jgi:EAL domain-containing protein (putative c-di-GMP-specific phosphodiesterase class I)
MGLLMAAQFDTGFYRRIRMVSPDGKVLFDRLTDAHDERVPGWFVSLVPIDSAPGRALVSDGWRELGQVEVESQTAYAHDALWSSSIRNAVAMALVGLLASALGMLLVRRISRSLNATVDQAKALEQGKFIQVVEPPEPELGRLTRAMNSLVDRLRATSSAQAEQIDALYRQANGDALTGLSNRKHFLIQLTSALQSEDGPAEGGLVLLRVMDLAGLNRQLGHAAVDRLLLTIAESLSPYADRVHGCFTGRLNGSDFALCLPAPGVARETAHALSDALRLVLPSFEGNAAVCIGAVEIRRGLLPGQMMAAADTALARAELRGPFAVEVAGDSSETAPVMGEGAWRQCIRQALDRQGLRLMDFRVLNDKRQVVHLECPLRMQLVADGPFEPAARWLPLAVRSRVTADIDERALELAIQASEIDGQPRAVNLSPFSLTDSGFASRLRALLWAAPQTARLIWLELAETAAVEQFELLQEFGRQLRPTGVRFGIDHAGARLGQIPRLFEMGLDYVKLDASMVAGVGRDENRALFVRSTVTLLHGMSIEVYAEGVDDLADAAVLWECGIDGATGPLISELDPTAGRG